MPKSLLVHFGRLSGNQVNGYIKSLGIDGDAQNAIETLAEVSAS